MTKFTRRVLALYEGRELPREAVFAKSRCIGGLLTVKMAEKRYGELVGKRCRVLTPRYRI